MASDPHPILVVDDSEDARVSMRMLLESVGYRVVEAENGVEALLRLRAGLEPCIILLDLMMPVMDGFTFRQQQLAEPALAQIPVVVFSGRYNVEAAAVQLHAAGHFSKPPDFDTLLNLVSKHCTPSA